VGCYPSSPATYTSDLEEKFTGQLRDETGLDYFIARYYADGQGRFTGADPLSGWAEDPQSWNMYAYARNNPLLYVDPNGTEYNICYDEDLTGSPDCWTIGGYREDQEYLYVRFLFSLSREYLVLPFARTSGYGCSAYNSNYCPVSVEYRGAGFEEPSIGPGPDGTDGGGGGPGIGPADDRSRVRVAPFGIQSLPGCFAGTAMTIAATAEGVTEHSSIRGPRLALEWLANNGRWTPVAN
jgi:RHS repeat-associated protein